MSMDTSKARPEVGSFLYTSWGYDQTNITFYRVVGFTPSGKSLKVVEVMTYREPMGSQERVTPSDTPTVYRRWNADHSDMVETVAQPFNVLWKPDRGYTTIAGHGAWKWDGRPEYATAPGWGH